MKMATAASDAFVDVTVTGAMATVTLNRPKALNALTTAMRAAIAERIPVLARDPNVYATVLRSSSAKAFSAGADVREMTALGRERIADARKSFREEYGLNWLLECYSKPTISLIDGLCMGGGVGVTIYNTHRVAGENYAFAMPENAIGFFPDVGAACALSRLPDNIGLYLGLTGRTIGRADAYGLGLATHCIPAERYAGIVDALAGAQPVDPLLDDRHADPGPGELERRRETISKCFSAGAVEDILLRLGAIKGPDADWAGGVRRDLEARSPTSLKVAFRHIREAAAHDIRSTLMTDYRLSRRFLEGHDFYEGVRAVVVEKTGAPAWRPARLEDVTDGMVEAYFAPLGADELVLPTREEMQASRV